MRKRGPTLAVALLVSGCSGKVAGDQCKPLPCPYPGWDPDTCSCRDASDAQAQDAPATDAVSEGCEPIPCPYPGWDPDTCSCRDAGDAAVSDGPGPQCQVDSGNLVWAYKNCQSADDCEVRLHTVNCCGTMQYVGVSKSDAEAFAACEQAWTESLPECGCASQPTTAEDGNLAPDPSLVVVECTDFTMSGGICKTRVP